MNCLYCGCDVEDHPEASFPLGSFICGGCGKCSLIQSHVKKIYESEGFIELTGQEKEIIIIKGDE